MTLAKPLAKPRPGAEFTWLHYCSSGLTLGLMAVLAPIFEDSLASPLQEGQVATRDFRATSGKLYQQIRTELRRNAAEQRFSPIYTSPDTRVARRQLEQLRAGLAYIQTVRADSLATLEQKQDDLASLEDVALQQETVTTILNMNDARWQEVQQQALAVLERVMSTGIRPETLATARDRVPAMVSLSFPRTRQRWWRSWSNLYCSNSEYSEALTQAARSGRANRSSQPCVPLCQARRLSHRARCWTQRISKPCKDWAGTTRE